MRIITLFLFISFSFCSIEGLWKCKINDSKFLIYQINEIQENSGTYKFFKYYKTPDKKLKFKDSGSWLVIDGDICLFNDQDNSTHTYCGKLKFNKKKNILILEDRERYVFNKDNE